MRRALSAVARPLEARIAATGALHHPSADVAATRKWCKPGNPPPVARECSALPFSAFRAAVKGVRASSSGAAPSKGEAGVIPFNLADIGEGITEVEVLRWFIEEGDEIKAFDRICEVQSDKATVEISSRYDGKVVKIYHATGDIALVGKPLIDIETTSAGNVPAKPPTPSKPEPIPVLKDQGAKAEDSKPLKELLLGNDPLGKLKPTNPSTAAVHNGASVHQYGGKPTAVPAVRSLVKQHGLNLADIPGTGKDGRVLKSDVFDFMQEAKFQGLSIETPMPPPPPAAPAAAMQKPAPPRAESVKVVPGAPPKADRVEPVRGYMRTMIKTMQAQAAVPHMGLSDEFTVGEAVRFRDKLKAAAEAKGVKVTLLPILVKALSTALSDYPEINARLSDDLNSIEYRGSHNVGIAIETTQGLVVPNVKNVQSLSVFEIAQEISRLVELAKESKLSGEHLSGGTITLSNIGAIGGTYAAPILMPKESVIAALGSIQRLPRYDVAGELKETLVMNVSWSADHRLLQGSVLARFSNRVKELMQDPTVMMLNMR